MDGERQRKRKYMIFPKISECFHFGGEGIMPMTKAPLGMVVQEHAEIWR